MNLFKQFETDPNLEKNGIVIDYGPNEHLNNAPIEFKVARSGGANTAYNKRIEVLAKKHRRAIQNDTIDPAVLQDIGKQAFVDTVLLGWNNVTDKNGVVIEFNTANAVQLFKTLPDLYNDLAEQSGKAALFRNELREDDAKN